MTTNPKALGPVRAGEDRVAAALRENLRKRKQQEQKRAMKSKSVVDKNK